MYSFKQAFTIIELIFIIVIIGILVMVAIPKLSATKKDAINARDCKNTAICITDVIAYYTATQISSKSNSIACTKAESSSTNNISIDLNGSFMTVSGVPHRCRDLNRTFEFGGSRVIN